MYVIQNLQIKLQQASSTELKDWLLHYLTHFTLVSRTIFSFKVLCNEINYTLSLYISWLNIQYIINKHKGNLIIMPKNSIYAPFKAQNTTI